MKRNQLLIRIMTLLLVLSLVCGAGVFSAFAEMEGEGDQPAVQEQQEEAPAETPQDVPAETPQEEAAETPQDQSAADEPQYEPIYEYIYSYDEDGDTGYEAPQNLGDLPEVKSGEVVEATAVVIPDIAVSDASLFSGIVMWLCVALGIAVVVGVLVSKRTRRRGV